MELLVSTPRWLGLAYNMSISDWLHLINSQMWHVISCQGAPTAVALVVFFFSFFSRLSDPSRGGVAFFELASRFFVRAAVSMH